jgi:hypothetical protein
MGVKKRMSEQDWTDQVEEFAELDIGENTFEITGEPHVEEGKFGKRLHIPTNIGVWRISLNSPIAQELKQISRKIGRLSHVSLTVVKTGKDKDTRYSIKKTVLPSQKQHETPPKNQLMLNLEGLTDEQREQVEKLQEMLKPKNQDATATS